MRAVLLVAGFGLRSRWRDWLVLTVLIGLAGGVVLATAAGARRTVSAYPRIAPRLAPGPGRAAALRGFERAMTPFCARVGQSTCLVTDQRPNGVTNYVSIDRTPQVLAALLAVLGLAVLAQFAATSARHSRRDFAVLATLGLRRRQLRAIRTWQLTLLTGLALVAGLPLGLAAGRYAWTRFAAGVGVPVSPVIPVALVLLSVPVALGAAAALALRPAGRPGRESPAQALRTE
jgi:hypothetical protein